MKKYKTRERLVDNNLSVDNKQNKQKHNGIIYREETDDRGYTGDGFNQTFEVYNGFDQELYNPDFFARQKCPFGAGNVTVQPKLNVSQPGDKAEKEADEDFSLFHNYYIVRKGDRLITILERLNKVRKTAYTLDDLLKMV